MNRHRHAKRRILAYPVECNFVVLDANCVRYSPVAELEAIKRRGFRLSASIEGVREVWSKSLRQNKHEPFARRVAHLAPLLDTESPLAFVSTRLVVQIGSAPPSVKENERRERESIVNGWRTALQNPLSSETWRTVGAELDAELRSSEQGWVRDLGLHMPRLRRLKETIRARGGSPPESDVLIDALLEGAPATTSPPLRQRMEAYVAYMLDKLNVAETEAVEENDYCDSRHLQHIAWPAFLMTTDLRLIETLERCCPIQRAWVRTPVEFAEDRIPRCLPWGRTAQSASAALPLRDRASLDRRLKGWRERLPKPSSGQQAS